MQNATGADPFLLRIFSYYAARRHAFVKRILSVGMRKSKLYLSRMNRPLASFEWWASSFDTTYTVRTLWDERYRCLRTCRANLTRTEHLVFLFHHNFYRPTQSLCGSSSYPHGFFITFSVSPIIMS